LPSFSHCRPALGEQNILIVTACYRCWAEVDLHALRQNLGQIRALAGPGRNILTVVKADAYGHGLRQTAALLMQSGTDIFGVANLAEARAIRAVGQGWPILMLGACLPEEVEVAVREGVMPTLSTLEEARLFSAAAAGHGKVVSAHLKVDTGMGRLGAPVSEAVALLDEVEKLPALVISGLYTHYSSAEEDAAFTRRQKKVFAALVDTFASQGKKFRWLHASNSGALLLDPDDFCNTVRPGLLVYGIVPAGRRRVRAGMTSRFQPALAWKCRVSLVKEVPAGTPISYGRAFVSQRTMRVATVTAGYGDGFFRAASNRASVLVSGRRCPVLGRVTMDQMVVDVSGVAEVSTGDEVVLMGRQSGEQITAGELADWCRTVPWEILTNITYRVPRIYRGEHAA
jgi:alanine racemase